MTLTLRHVVKWAWLHWITFGENDFPRYRWENISYSFGMLTYILTRRREWVTRDRKNEHKTPDGIHRIIALSKSNIQATRKRDALLKLLPILASVRVLRTPETSGGQWCQHTALTHARTHTPNYCIRVTMMHASHHFNHVTYYHWAI